MSLFRSSSGWTRHTILAPFHPMSLWCAIPPFALRFVLMPSLCVTPIFDLFSRLSSAEYIQAVQYLSARYNSDDTYAELLKEAYGPLRPFLLSQDGDDNPLASGSVSFWEQHSLRGHPLAAQIGKHMCYLAQHCPGFAHSSGGRVSSADAAEKLEADGHTNRTIALAIHGLAA